MANHEFVRQMKELEAIQRRLSEYVDKLLAEKKSKEIKEKKA